MGYNLFFFMKNIKKVTCIWSFELLEKINLTFEIKSYLGRYL